MIGPDDVIRVDWEMRGDVMVQGWTGIKWETIVEVKVDPLHEEPAGTAESQAHKVAGMIRKVLDEDRRRGGADA